MPFYDYKCTNCNNIHEERHSILTTRDIPCNKCGKPCIRIMPQSANYILKGDDWADKRNRKNGN